MQAGIKSLLIFFSLVLFFSNTAFAQSNNAHKPVPIIFDTDMGPDYDDIGAIALLHAMADNNECTILATVASNRNPIIGEVLDVMNTYFGRPDIPIGIVQGNAANIVAVQKWDSFLVSKYPHDAKNETCEVALKLYRKILAGQPDKSVTIVTVGFLTNMANLLQSAPDEFSSLTGKELVDKKVKQLVCMAGCFDNRMGTFKEFNVKIDAAASGITFNEWPTPVLFSGFEIGAAIFTGLPIVNSHIENSPVKDVFKMSIPLDPNDKNGRMSWDETAVLVAVRGYQDYFDIVQGTFICNVDGSNSWDYNGKRDSYLVQKMSIPEIEKILNELMMHQPVRK